MNDTELTDTPLAFLQPFIVVETTASLKTHLLHVRTLILRQPSCSIRKNGDIQRKKLRRIQADEAG